MYLIQTFKKYSSQDLSPLNDVLVWREFSGYRFKPYKDLIDGDKIIAYR